MKSVKHDVAVIFKLVAQALSEMKEEEIQDLLQGQGKLTYIPKNNGGKEQEKKISRREFGPIIEKLAAVDTREAARTFLAEHRLLKNDLVKLASLLDIFISKNDGKDKITEKIVESTVGARIRAKAIKDTRVRHGSGT